MVNDVSSAFFNAPSTCDLVIELPAEDPLSGGSRVGKLNVSLYSTRDAAVKWQRCLSEHLLSIGFEAGVGHPRVFVHRGRQLYCPVRGDDYFAAGGIADLRSMDSKLNATFEIQTHSAGDTGRDE